MSESVRLSGCLSHSRVTPITVQVIEICLAQNDRKICSSFLKPQWVR